MDPTNLLLTHLHLECIGLDLRGRLARIPGPSPDDISRVYVSEQADGIRTFFREDLREDLVARLQAIEPADMYRLPRWVAEILAEDAPCEEWSECISYVFPDDLPATPRVRRLAVNDRDEGLLIAAYDPELLDRPGPVFAIVEDGRIVSSCSSARENDAAGEAWVRTQLAYRRRGLARQVTAAWAADLARQGKIAFYSHRSDNPASAALARSLGLHAFTHDIGFL
ncbi:MAG TPA: GNAT family N-acetyltransferase [Chloroflexota bacterium]|nr:GNAT family N-acetyltransferase [Chloroflexota bacterium]